MNKYKVFTTKTFNNMLKVELTKLKFYSKKYALSIEKKVIESIKLLENFPYIAPLFKLENVSFPYRKFIIEKNFFIIFKIQEYKVFFLYFFNAKQSPNNFFKFLK